MSTMNGETAKEVFCELSFGEVSFGELPFCGTGFGEHCRHQARTQGKAIGGGARPEAGYLGVRGRPP